MTLATTPDGDGYYMFEPTGRSPPSVTPTRTSARSPSRSTHPVVFGQATSTGKGYWEFAADGGVFTFGDAPFEGSLGSLKLNAPINGAIAFGSTG